MFDGIKIIDLPVSIDALLQNDRLMFPLAIDERTGSILDRPRRSYDRGLTFTLVPRNIGGTRCELQGSLHRYYNDGLHNADDFTAFDLLESINDLVTTYDIDPHKSHLNNIEFGVNIRLPFPVVDLLDRLICYKGVPFVRDTDNGGIYYQATLKQYAVKLYDKAKQYGLLGNILRVEVKVFRMQFLTNKGIFLNTLFDLLNVEMYSRLGSLLLDTFQTILIDDPTTSVNGLSNRDREQLLNGRNPRFWQLPAPETFSDRKEYDRRRKQLQRDEKRFKVLLSTYRQGEDWQTKTAQLIKTKWDELTAVSSELKIVIHDQLLMWENGNQQAEKCPNITDPINNGVSQFYPLGLV